MAGGQSTLLKRLAVTHGYFIRETRPHRQLVEVLRRFSPRSCLLEGFPRTITRETIWRPALEVRRTKDAFVVEAAVAGLDPKQFDVRVTPTELLLAADVHHSDREQEGETVLCEFVNGPLFRSYKFPEPIDPSRVVAEYRNGLLRVSAPLAHPATKVEIQAA